MREGGFGEMVVLRIHGVESFGRIIGCIDSRALDVGKNLETLET
jgi:hypothetical protein